MSDWDARLYRERTGFVSELGATVMELLAPQPGERILDLGCGDGALTARLAAMGCEVVGVDSSADMLAAARDKGLDTRLLDAAKLETADELANSFDAVFSNAALHWMHPIDVVVRGIARALKPGGRFVAEFGGCGNVERIRRAIHGALVDRGIEPDAVDPWHFATAEEYSTLLQAADLQVASIELFERPTELPSGIAGWVESVGRPFLAAVDPSQHQGFLMDVEERAAGELRRGDGTWWADYVRLRVRAFRKELA